MTILKSQYLHVTDKDILLVEIHNTSSLTRSWLRDQHLQEILELLRDAIRAYVEIVSKKNKTTTAKQQQLPSDIVTGTIVRVGFVFKKRPGNQFCVLPTNVLSLNNSEDDELTSLHVLREKLVVYTYPLASSSPQKMSQLMKVFDDKRRMSGKGVSISSYFQKISSSQTGSGSQFSHKSVCNSTIGNQSAQYGSQTSVISSTDSGTLAGKQTTQNDDHSTATVQCGSHSVKELPITVEKDVSQSVKVTEMASVLPEAPPSEGRRHIIKNILQRGDIGPTKRKRRKVNVAQLSKGDEQIQNASLNEYAGKKPKDSGNNKDSGNSQDSQKGYESCVIDGIKVSKVNEPCMEFNTDDPSSEQTVTLVSVEQMHEIKKASGISLNMSKRSLPSPECKSSSFPSESKSSDTSCGHPEPLSDESILPSASFCTQAGPVSSASNSYKDVDSKRLLKSDDNICDIIEEMSDSPKFVGKKIEEIQKQKVSKENNRSDNKSQMDDSSSEEKDGDEDSSKSAGLGSTKTRKCFRFKRKYPSFSDSDSEDRTTIPEKKMAKRNGAQSQAKFVKLDQMKMSSKKFSLSKSFFTDDSNKAKQPTLSFFINNDGRKKTTDISTSVVNDEEKYDDVTDIECELIKELSDFPKVKNEADTELRNEVRSLSSVQRLNEEHVRYMIRNNEKYLRSIFEGKVLCQRHQSYKQGGRSRRDLNYESRLGLYSEEQVDTVMECLIAIFCKKHHKYLDYIMKVLLPEMLIKLHMDVSDTNHEESEKMLAPKVTVGLEH